ncbi:nitrous oxide reductase accessory protein NosL [Paenibacillus residui]|uniref:Nitrous oxide reductase accessory protein NosL n=1 Tax=Paenibacillus residui TaxID=629724 RepID=A0ABW3DAU0_9BACL
MKKSVFILLSVMVMIMASACGKKEEYTPAAINEGVDRCEVCNMMIADDHNATQIVLKDGRSLKFDDIGDLFVWTKKNGLDQVGQRFVRDYHSKEWLKLEDAYYAYDSTFKTPMAFGVYSFKDKADAEKFIEEQGKGVLMSAADLDSHSWESNMEHGHDHGHSEGQEGHSKESHGSGHEEGSHDSHKEGTDNSGHGDENNNSQEQHKETDAK